MPPRSRSSTGRLAPEQQLLQRALDLLRIPGVWISDPEWLPDSETYPKGAIACRPH